MNNNDDSIIDKIQLILAFASIIVLILMLILQIAYDDYSYVIIKSICPSCENTQYYKIKKRSIT